MLLTSSSKLFLKSALALLTHRCKAGSDISCDLILFTDLKFRSFFIIFCTELLDIPNYLAISRCDLWVPGISSWEHASSRTSSTCSSVRAVLFLPLPSFLSIVPVFESFAITWFTCLGFHIFPGNSLHILLPRQPFSIKQAWMTALSFSELGIILLKSRCRAARDIDNTENKQIWEMYPFKYCTIWCTCNSRKKWTKIRLIPLQTNVSCEMYQRAQKMSMNVQPCSMRILVSIFFTYNDMWNKTDLRSQGVLSKPRKIWFYLQLNKTGLKCSLLGGHLIYEKIL